MNTPRYEYSRKVIADRIALLTGLDLPYGLTVRYAMKANPFPAIISMMHEGGVHFDASSSYEAAELLAAGIPGPHISLSSQQTPHNLLALLADGVQFVATSLHQLDMYLNTPHRPSNIAIRINPNLGHGHNARTSTGGVAASFGIWHEYIPEVLAKAASAGVPITRLHLHIGSGADPKVWGEVMARALEIVSLFPDVTTLDIGGGYKVHRYGEEKEADLTLIAAEFSTQLKALAAATGRELALEIEPGTYFIAHAGVLVATIDDIVDTGKDGYQFLKLNTGMNDFLRTTMYGAQHHIEVMNDADTFTDYVVVGHNCESGDIFTTAPGDSESIVPRTLKTARIGDEVRIYDTGAYCASMRARGYHSFPIAPEVMVD